MFDETDGGKSFRKDNGFSSSGPVDGLERLREVTLFGSCQYVRMGFDQDGCLRIVVDRIFEHPFEAFGISRSESDAGVSLGLVDAENIRALDGAVVRSRPITRTQGSAVVLGKIRRHDALNG